MSNKEKPPEKKKDYLVGNKRPPPWGQIKKGEIRNPNGARAHDPVKKALKRLTSSQFIDVIHLALTSNIKGLKEIAEDPNTPAIKVGVAISLVKAIQKGDWNIIEGIAARIVGNVPAKFEVSGADGGPIKSAVLALTKEECEAEIKRLDDLRAQTGDD